MTNVICLINIQLAWLFTVPENSMNVLVACLRCVSNELTATRRFEE
ncbi:MAG: hypothetical protein ISQ09_07845 [Rubripirellula sp.]|nr:hypothetical protein [Rubripirellula sp.]